MTQSLRTPIVQKFGGSSLSSLEKVRAVARKVLRSADSGRPVVVVVSAMGNTTSELIERARSLTDSPPRRELDVLLSSGERMSTALLAMAIEEEGGSAISLTGPQSGILTDDQFTNANILDVRPDRVMRELAAGQVVIVAGFQGENRRGDITTLGRGGSDTTAVALAGALGAECCEIYSDVDGVYSADPRVVEEPLHLKEVDSRLMTEYALHGARVLHPGCIQLAHEKGVAIHASSTFGDDTHTRIRRSADLSFSLASSDGVSVVGVTSRKHRLRIHGDASRDLVRCVLDEVGGEEAVLSAAPDELHDLLVDIEDLPDPERVTANLRESLGSYARITEKLASVSIVTEAAHAAEVERGFQAALEDASVAPIGRYRRAHSLTCTASPAERERTIRALHAHLVEKPVLIGA
ncbi:MAG: aspartate kinase [Paracoccaceae bacterium]